MLQMLLKSSSKRSVTVRDSEAIIEYYKNQSTFDFDKYYVAIEEFVKNSSDREEDNRPLLIAADEGVGRKALLVKWMEYHETHRTTVK